MDATFWFNVLMRWLHVGAAVVGVGGTLMMRLVVLPALERLPNGGEVLQAIRPAFKRLIHSAIGLLLLTGFYNYIAVAIPKVRAFREAVPNPMAGYHAVMGGKILLSLVLFGIALALLAPVPSFHENRKSWLSVNVVLGLAILALGAYLRRLWPVATP
jgi:putative copper export protein